MSDAGVGRDPERQTQFRIAVVERDARSLESLAAQLGQAPEVVSFPSLQALQLQLSPGVPVVVVLGPSFRDPADVPQVEWLSRTAEVGLILVVPELSTEMLQQAMRAGVRDVLARPDRAQLVWAVERVAESLDIGAGGSPNPGPTLSDTPGKVTTVFSPKGGAGTSVVASNLAVILAGRSARTVALVDADLQFGDIAVMLKTKLEHTIIDAAAAGTRLDPTLLQSLMVPHEPSGLMVLPAPIEPALAEKVSADDLRRIIEVLRTFCDHVIVDTPSTLNDVVLSLLDQSDEILLVSPMEVPGVKNLKLSLEILRLLETELSKIKLVLIQSGGKVGMEARDIERAVGLKADSVLPHDAAVPASLNTCVPVVSDAPRSPIARSLEALGDRFVPRPQPGKWRPRRMRTGAHDVAV